MVNNIKQNKAQGLPLNTIVIAILVIIVLLVIVVFFTTKVGDTSQQLDDKGSVSACDVDSNPAVATLGYVNAKYIDLDTCKDQGGSRITIVSNNEDDEVCCGFK